MKRFLSLTLFAALAVVSTRPLHAQSGCDDSPENPTLLLAGLAAGAYAVTSLRARFRR